jgi:zinc transport system substrate-binding protein
MFGMQMRGVQVRNIFIIGLFLLMVFFRLDEVRAEEAKQISIVASFYPMYIMAKNVTRDVPGISVKNLTPPLTGCLHDYTVTTNDMKKLAHAQVFVANGAGMESFLAKIVAGFPQIKIIQLADGIALIKGEGDEGDNPHVWVSLSGAIAEVENLGRAMEQFDPAHRDLYRKNTADYVAKLENLRDKMRAELAPYKGMSIITFHEAFPYFAKEFDLKIAAVVEREPGSEPSAKELADTIELIKKNGIPALFSEPQYPAASAETIVRETGAKVYVLDPAVTGPDDPDAYLNIMENNLKILKQAFEGQG